MAIDRTKISRLAENHMAMGRVDRAIEEFLKLIEDRADDFNLLNRVGDAYLQAGKVADALDLFKKAGAGFERGGFNAKATAVFKKAHRIAAEDVEIAERLADLYRQTNMIKEAIQIHIEVADVCTRKGLIKRALEAFAKVVDLDPKNLKNKVKLADLYHKEGMKERAAGIYLEVAEILALEQKPAEAGQILERAKSLVSTPQVFLTQSRLCVIQKDLAAAAQHLREGLEVNPRSPELLDALAEVELQSRRPEQALEALGQAPQLAQKSLLLCERALRDLVRSGAVAEALRLFKPIGRDFARRGIGEAAARALSAGLQGAMTAEAWLQMGEIAHQGGSRDEEVECLRHAFQEAGHAGDPEQAEAIAQRLQGLGVRQDQVSAPFASDRAGQMPAEAPAPESEDVAMLRLQVEKLERDAAHALQNRYMDSALDSFNKILELDPANPGAIEAIADIHRASGLLTKVQMHYVKMAEKLAALGRRGLAVELLDRAEAMFPGSTRLYRRTLGLLNVIPEPPADPRASAAIGAPASLAAPDNLERPSELPRIDLDLEPRSWARPRVPEPKPLPEPLPLEEPVAEPAPVFFPPPVAQPPAFAPEPPPPFAEPEVLEELQELPEYEGSEFSGVLDPAGAADPAPVSEELAATLSDIDFQMDYGSPEEALIEIDSALERHADHPELQRRKHAAELALQRLGHGNEAAEPERNEATPSFFDLTDVLGDSLLEPDEGEEMHDATNVVEKIQSVDELFNAFRAGVEQQVKVDDYDTHYNLGIAYKEMLLLEPAIEEFKTAMRDPERTLECCSMLAICEHTQGDLDAAVQWLLKGIQAPGFPPEDAIGLYYDLGNLYRVQDQPAAALEAFQKVQALNPDYRDVARMLEHLEQAVRHGE